MQGQQFSEYITNDEVLQIAVENGILDLKEIAADVDKMKRRELLSLHTHEIWQNSKGMYLTYVYDENGNRKIRRRKTKEEIEQLLVDHYRSQEEEIYLRDVFEQWVDMKLRFGEIQRQSYDRYKTDFARFFPASENICRKKFRNINEKDLEEFIKRTIHDKKLTRKSYNGLVILINGIFKYGKHEGLTQISITQFMGDLELPRNLFEVKERRKEQETFSEEEIPVIRKYLTQNPDIWNLGLMLLFQTGMRVGEVTTLKQEDIGDHSVHVRRNEFKYKDAAGKSHVGVKEQPKTDAGNREIILPPQAMETLYKIIEKNPNGEYLLMNNGIRIRGTTLTKRISDICRKLKLEHHSAHKIRKTYGTTLLDSSVRETGKARTDGFAEIFVNAAVKNYDDELNTNVSDLMDLFTDREKLNLEKFPEFSKRKNTFVNTAKGETEMCEKVEQLAREREKEAILVTLFEGVQDGGMKVTYAAKKANLSLNEFKDQMRLRGFNVPRRRTVKYAK